MSQLLTFNNETVSAIGYGCYALSGAYGARLRDEKKVDIIRAAFQLGVRLFDTASKYGNTEEILGKAIGGFRKEVFLATKVNYDFSLSSGVDGVITSCERSLKRLQTDYIDLLQIHFDDPKTPVYETVGALERLKKEGKIRYYGVGHLPLERITEYLKHGNISTVLAEMNAVNQLRYKELLSLQNSYDFSIIGFSITGRGLLTGKIKTTTSFLETDLRSIDPLFKKSRFDCGLRVAEKLKEIGSRYGKSPAQIAISWAILQPGITAALIGPTKHQHLQENLQVLEWQLPASDIKELNVFLDDQEVALNNSIKKDIMQLLQKPLANFKQGFTDIVYVLENSIELNLISSEVGIPIYMNVLELKKDTIQDISALREVQQELANLISIYKH